MGNGVFDSHALPPIQNNLATKLGRSDIHTTRQESCQLMCEEEELLMAAHAGETARETGDFHCQSCNAVVHVTKGKKIPECPKGHKTFDERTGEPGNKSSK
jgi:hypothetical protein